VVVPAVRRTPGERRQRHDGGARGALLEPHYGADFYAAYVRDPDGNKLAAVCRGFTARQRD
jgi:hypothetical protein